MPIFWAVHQLSRPCQLDRGTLPLGLTSRWARRILRFGPVGPVLQADLHSIVGVGLGAFRGIVEELNSRVSDVIHRVVVYRRDAAVRD